MTGPQKIQKKQKKDDFLMQGMILAIAMVMTKVIGVVYRIPLTNILGDEGNGFYGYAFEVYAMALMLSSLSLPTAVSKLVSARMAMGQRRNAFRVFLGSLLFSLAVGILISLIIFLGAGTIASDFMESPLSVYALRVLAVGLFIVALLGVLRGYFQGLGTMMPTAVSQIIEQIINAVVSIAGAGVLFKIGVSKGKESGEELLALPTAPPEELSERYLEHSLHFCFFCFVSMYSGAGSGGGLLQTEREGGRVTAGF